MHSQLPSKFRRLLPLSDLPSLLLVLSGENVRFPPPPPICGRVVCARICVYMYIYVCVCLFVV